MAAAAQLSERRVPFVLFERGAQVGEAMRAWSHVQVFSPWEYNIDKAARRLLEASGWEAPDEEALPTGGELVSRYLQPLAELPQIAPHLQLGATVRSITREGLDKMTSTNRDNVPFAIRWVDLDGRSRFTRASAIIDASGTWEKPNPIGVDGLTVPGEADNSDLIAYGIPDVAGRDRELYEGKRVLVVGSGHSAIQSALALLSLKDAETSTKVTWALRRNRIERLLGGGLNDQLPARGALGLAARRAIDDGRLDVLAPFSAYSIRRAGAALEVEGALSGHALTVSVDRIIVATGFRPNLDMASELRVQLDPAVEAPPALAPLIDPNFHSCGSVPPHGVDELTHPEKNFFIVGSKSYGRAPTFLMATGYEQVRSIADELAGNPVAARQVQLVLPETGVCSSSRVTGEASEACCGGPAATADSCCVADEVAKSEGQAGCGCGTSTTVTKPALVVERA